MSVNVKTLQKPVKKTAPPATPSVRKGTIEGTVVVNGRVQMESSDMPTISFESILAMQKATEIK